MPRPGIVGMRGSMVIRLRPCMISSTSLRSSTPPPADINSRGAKTPTEPARLPYVSPLASRCCTHVRAHAHTARAPATPGDGTRQIGQVHDAAIFRLVPRGHALRFSEGGHVPRPHLRAGGRLADRARRLLRSQDDDAHFRVRFRATKSSERTELIIAMPKKHSKQQGEASSCHLPGKCCNRKTKPMLPPLLKSKAIVYCCCSPAFTRLQ